MKTCRTCKLPKPLTEFYQHAAMRDGYLSDCKACKRAAVTANRELKAEHYSNYDRSRDSRPDRVATRAKYARSVRGRRAHRRADKAYRVTRMEMQ